jgi:beta-N-acetylhexosaminidase
MREMATHGILACAKHFPGHGDTHVDSHWALPIVDSSLEALRTRELAPFAALVKAQVPMIMTCHVIFPKVDPTHTATTSKILLEDVLRNELGFRGTVVADALGMKAIAASVSDEATVRDCLVAGLDLLLMAGDNVSLADAAAVERLIDKIHRSAELTEAPFEGSRRRIDEVFAKCAHYPIEELPAKTLGAHAALAAELESRKDWEAFNLQLPGFE